MNRIMDNGQIPPPPIVAAGIGGFQKGFSQQGPIQIFLGGLPICRHQHVFMQAVAEFDVDVIQLLHHPGMRHIKTSVPVLAVQRKNRPGCFFRHHSQRQRHLGSIAVFHFRRLHRRFFYCFPHGTPSVHEIPANLLMPILYYRHLALKNKIAERISVDGDGPSSAT